MALCKECKDLPSFLHNAHGTSRKHKDSWDLLLISASSCALCALVVEGFDRAYEISDWHSPRHMTGPSEIELETIGGKIRALCGYGSSQAFFSESIYYREETEAALSTWKDRSALSTRLNVAKAWVQECQSRHESCHLLVGNTLPTRLISVGSLGQAPSPYATLSHCWGPPPHPLRLLKSTIDQLQIQIPWDSLPKTFKDAINITRELGLEFLWIDSLCIVQDDNLDWEQEAAKMANVYQNSYPTIAATASNGPEGGCIQSDYPSTMIDFRDTGESVTNTRSGIYHFSISFNVTNSLDLSPLNTRGWVKQEMILSPRILHCCRDQLVWQCFTQVESEHGDYFEKRRDGRAVRMDFRDMFYSLNTWWEWVYDYRGRTLTRSNDMLVAFAGITTFFDSLSRKSAGQHILGLWSNDLPCGLLWGTQRGDGQSSLLENAPSWSWISSTGDIKKPRFYEKTRMRTQYHQLPMAEVVSTDIEWKGTPLTSALNRAELFVAARLQIVHVGADDTFPTPQVGEYNQYLHGNWGRELYPYSEGDKVGTTGATGLLSDDGSRPALGTVLTCLQIAVSYSDKTSGYEEGQFRKSELERDSQAYASAPEAYHHFLALEATGEQRVYRRIGIGHVLLSKEDTSWKGFHVSSRRLHVYLV